MKIIAVILLAIMCIAEYSPDDAAEEYAVQPLIYGPGHETHQPAAWDNGDGTHSVACDCGIEKIVELHRDRDENGFCDICGLEY